MLSMLDFLAGWAEGWTASGRPDVSVAWERSPEDRDKQSCWMTVQGPAAWGQITVWESGELQVEAMSVETGTQLVAEHAIVDDTEGLQRAIRRLVSVCEV